MLPEYCPFGGYSKLQQKSKTTKHGSLCLENFAVLALKSQSGPMSKNSPEKGPISLSGPEIRKCDF